MLDFTSIIIGGGAIDEHTPEWARQLVVEITDKLNSYLHDQLEQENLSSEGSATVRYLVNRAVASFPMTAPVPLGLSPEGVLEGVRAFGHIADGLADRLADSYGVFEKQLTSQGWTS